MALGNKKSVDDAAFELMALGNQTSRSQWHWEIKKSLDADLQIAPDANEPVASPVEDADLIAPHPKTYYQTIMHTLTVNWDDVIVIPK
ncbi:hypothetical protein Tco_1538739 [Tanacetum coccineum]